MAWIGGGSSVKQRLPVLTQLFGRDCNPLRRGVDRAEALLMTAVVVVFVVVWLVLAVTAGQWADSQGRIQQRAEQGWRPAIATLLESAAQAASSSSQMGVAWVPARWQAPDGQPRSGQVPTELDAKAGRKVGIWIDANGGLTHSRLTSAAVRDQVAFTVLSVTMAVALAFGVVMGCIRLLFNRRRMAGWQRDWEAVGPTWSRQG
jgi:hypothetical protein